MPKRPFVPTLLLVTTVLWLVGPWCVAQAAPALKGTVVDAAGSPLQQVQVFLGRAEQQVLVSSTDARGVYQFASLAPGRYTLLAMKSGYVAAFSQVDTLLQNSVDLTLRVLGEPAHRPVDPAALPGDAAWVLRHPVRDVLRSVEAPGAEAGPPAEEAAPALAADVRQWVSGDGYRTDLRFDGQPAEAVAWSLEGTLERADRDFSGQDLARRDAENDRLDVAVDLRPTPAHALDLRAAARRAELAFELDDAGAGAPEGRDTETWGFSAAWRYQRPDGSDLHVEVGHGSAAARRDALGVPQSHLSEDSWHVLSSFRFQPASRHQVELSLRADGYRSDALERLTFHSDLAPAGLMGSGEDGWTVNLSGRDTYTVLRPLDLELGLEYQRLGYDDDLSYFTPQAGVAYRPARGQTVRAVVLMQFADASDPQEDRLLEAPGASRKMGYMLTWEHETDQELSYSVSAAVGPYTGDTGLPGGAFSVGDHRAALFGTDGKASARELGFGLQKRYRGVEGSTNVRIGDIEGNLVSFLPGEIPTQRLARNDAWFVSTRLQTSIAQSGTRIHIGYHWVENEGLQLQGQGLVPMRYSSLDMEIRQQLPILLGRSDWDVLLGYQGIQNKSSPEGALGLARLGVAEEAHRVSGGVAVSF
jgi:hypothetical protein